MPISESGHVLICNFPGVNKIVRIIQELTGVDSYRDKRFVLVADAIDELPEELQKEGVLFVKGTATDEDILMQANILESDGVIILAEDEQNPQSDERTYTITSIIELMEKEHSRPIKTIAEVVSEKNVRNMERALVDGFTSEDGLSSCMLVQEFINPGITRVISQLVTNLEGSQLFLKKTKAEGHKLRELQIAALNHEANIQIIGLRRDGANILNPDKQILLSAGDELIVLADNSKDIRTIEKMIT